MTSSIETEVARLLGHVRTQHPGTHWALLMRPEAALQLDPEASFLRHPDLRYAPLPIKSIDGCEVTAGELLAGIVMASPVDEFGFTHLADSDFADVPNYWLILSTGQIKEWTEHSLAELKAEEAKEAERFEDR